MQPDSRQGIVLRFLQERRDRFGPAPAMFGRAEWRGLIERTGAEREQIGSVLDELVEEGYAEGHPEPGTGMHPRDGMVWIARRGRDLVETWRRPPPPPAPIPFESTRIGDEVLGQIGALYAAIDRTAADPRLRDEVRRLVAELQDPDADRETRLGNLERLVTIVSGSQQLAAATWGHWLPIGDLIPHLRP